MLAISPSSPSALKALRTELSLEKLVLASDEAELSVATLCGGVSHCVLLVNPGGEVTWGAWSESWAELPKARDIFAAARRLRR